MGGTLRRELALILAARSLSAMEKLLLVLILHTTHDGWCSLSTPDMAWYLRSNPDTVTRARRHLIELGVLERSPHPGDARRLLWRVNLHGFRNLD